MTASSFYVYDGMYLATPRGLAVARLVASCTRQALAHRPSMLNDTFIEAMHQAAVCDLGAHHAEALWGLLGIGALALAAGAIFLAQPWWYRQQRRLTPLTGDEDTENLLKRLEGVRRRAAAGRVTWLLEAGNLRLSAFAFGRPGRRYVAISGGAAIAAVKKPADFDAVVLHELAHVRNRDIDQTYLALAFWRAFVITALVPMAALLIFTRELGSPQRVLWRVAALALIVYSLRNSVLRSREFDADARATELDPGTALSAVLARMPAPTGRRSWPLRWQHPPGPERAAALLDPAPLYQFGFRDGLAIGLVSMIGASAVGDIVTLLSTTRGVTLLVPAVIFAALGGAALAVAMWRKQLHQPDMSTVKGWTAGLGLGLGLATGHVIVLREVFAPALAPDRLGPASAGVLAVWIGLAVLISVPFPVWVGHWADAWQGTERVPARGGLLAAVLAAWAIMTVWLYILLQAFSAFLNQPSAATEWHQLPEVLREVAAVVISRTVGSQAADGLVCLLAVGMPLAAALAHRDWRRPRMSTVLLGLTGCAVAVMLTLAASAVTHARISERLRWSSDFLGNLVNFDAQAVVVIAAVCALIVAARARSARELAASVVVAAGVGAAGAVTVSNLGGARRCFGWLSIWYAHPPGGSCVTSLHADWLGPLLLGAALVSVLVVPAAFAAGRRMRRAELPSQVTAFSCVAAAGAMLAVAAGAALWGPGDSARGVQPAGSIGRDGWIAGPGFEIRLAPSWYAVSTSHWGQLRFTCTIDGGTVNLISLSTVTSSDVSAYQAWLVGKGARAATLDGAPGLRLARSGLPRGMLEEWFIVRKRMVYAITLYPSPYGGFYLENSPFLRSSLRAMLRTWHWNN